MSKIIQIAAMSENRVIGRGGGIPWRVPEDTRFFRDTTRGHCCISGRRTFESYGHPLRDRLNVVITKQPDYAARVQAPDVVVVSSLNYAIAVCKTREKDFGSDIYICGGGEIYRQSLPITDVILLTVIHQNAEGDTVFPEFSESDFKLVSQDDRTGPVNFSFLRFERR